MSLIDGVDVGESNGSIAVITGITGQDGSYLAEHLLKKGYQVIGLMRRASTPNDIRIKQLLALEENHPEIFNMEYFDLIDDASIRNVMDKYKPTHWFNTAAMSHVAVSFPTPIATAEYNAVGVTRILEAIRSMNPKCKFLQCSSSEMFGLTPPPQDENTYMKPSSPYGAAKVYAYHMTRIYREGYGLHACNSICFNHDGVRRGVNFVTRKITINIAEIIAGKRKKITLGNLDAKRDWGSSKDYVEAMELIINQDTAEDFVVATRETHTIREYLDECFKLLGLNWEDYVEISDKFKRPLEVPALLGDPTKIENALHWEPKTKFKELVREMLESDLQDIAGLNIQEAAGQVAGIMTSKS